MDPFVSTIIRQAALAGLAVGAAVALIYGFVQYAKLQHALALNIVPPQLP